MLSPLRTNANRQIHSLGLHNRTAVPYNSDGVRAEAAQVGDAHGKGDEGMKCSIQGCPGEYEKRKVVHTVRENDQVIVIDHVPAQVCSLCGDTLLSPETVRRIEELLRERPSPSASVPLYEYA